jgi:hypothetical protein
VVVPAVATSAISRLTLKLAAAPVVTSTRSRVPVGAEGGRKVVVRAVPKTPTVWPPAIPATPGAGTPVVVVVVAVLVKPLATTGLVSSTPR